MKQHFWDRDLLELALGLYHGILRFFKEQVWPMMMGFSFFFFLAVPLLIVLGILWYLDSIDWKPEHGRYKIGLANSCRACSTSASLTSAPVPTWAAKSFSTSGVAASSAAMV